VADRARVRLVISGRVQGVAFRAHAADAAARLGVTGWIANLSDGRVEAVAEGERPAVEAFVAWCHRGPRSARVDRVEEVWDAHRGEFAAFDVRHGS
jgi:acylphosphatase